MASADTITKTLLMVDGDAAPHDQPVSSWQRRNTRIVRFIPRDDDDRVGAVNSQFFLHYFARHHRR